MSEILRVEKSGRDNTHISFIAINIVYSNLLIYLIQLIIIIINLYRTTWHNILLCQDTLQMILVQCNPVPTAAGRVNGNYTGSPTRGFFLVRWVSRYTAGLKANLVKDRVDLQPLAPTVSTMGRLSCFMYYSPCSK